MGGRRVWMGIIVLCIVLGVAGSARASNYVVYLHGRAQNIWPAAALLGLPAGWSHVTLSYDGDASLGNTSVQNPINDTIAARCGGSNQCVVVCYSAGCARMLLAYKQLRDQSRFPANILWSEAAASAAGGSELATISTKWYGKLFSKIFGLPTAAIDADIQPISMRAGTYANIQDQATSPVYHLAGSVNICKSLSIFFPFKAKLCGNSSMPGGYGDGVVPVHSAAGYSDTGAHANTNDGGAKYLFRAYEQTPLYPADHFGILAPFVSAASLRLAVNTSTTCANLPGVDAAIPDASIVYDDADAAVTQESSPLNTLVLCGASLWTGQPSAYGTCLSNAGCCTAFSSGDAGGCMCGETLCKQAQYAYRSYYTTSDCTGTEYAPSSGLIDFESYNGLGMAGNTTRSIMAKSARSWPDGLCQALVKETCYANQSSCCNDQLTSLAVSSARIVYRPAGGPPPPTGFADGLIVTRVSLPKFPCP